MAHNERKKSNLKKMSVVPTPAITAPSDSTVAGQATLSASVGMDPQSQGQVLAQGQVQGLSSRNSSLEKLEQELQEEKWPDVSGIPELTSVLKEHALPKPPAEDPPPVMRNPDLPAMYTELLAQMENDGYNKRTVDEVFHTIFNEMRKNKTLNDKLNERMLIKEEDLKTTQETYRNDPRVGKILKIAKFWRAEKDEIEELNKENCLLVEHLEIEIQGMTTAIDSSKGIVARLTKEVRIAADERLASDALQVKATQQGVELNECKEFAKDFKEQIEGLKKKIGSQNEHVKELMKVAQIASNYEQKMHQLELAKQKVESKYDDMLFKQKKTNLHIQSLTTHIESLLHNMADLQTKNREFEKGMGFVKSHLTRSANLLDARKVALDNCQKDATRQAEHRKICNCKLFHKEQELKHAKTKILSLEEMYMKLQHENKHVNNKLLNCHDKSAENGVEMNALKSNVLHLEHANQIINSKVTIMDRIIGKKTIELRSTNEEAEEARHRVLILLNNVEDMVRESLSLQHKNAALYKISLTMKDRWNAYRDLFDSEQKLTTEKEKKIMDMCVQIKRLEKGFVRLNDTIFKCQTKNHVMTSDAVKQMEEMRTMHRTLHFTVAEVKTSNAKCDSAQQQLQRMQLMEVRNTARINNLESECNAQRVKISSMVKDIREEKNHVEYYMREMNNLAELLTFENLRSKEFQTQRDIMGARVIRARAKESLLEEKYRVQEQIIKNGKTGFLAQNNDIMVLKKEISNQRRAIINLNRVQEDNKTLKDELIKCRKDLILVENKRTAAKGIINPRLHENRLLKAIFPSKYEMLVKNQKLVRCFISKVDDVITKEQEIIGLKKDIQTLKVILRSRSNPKIATEIIATRRDGRRKDRQIKSLMAELNCTAEDLVIQKEKNGNLDREFMKFKAKVNAGVYLPKSLSNPVPASTLPPIQVNQGFDRRKNQVGGGFVFSVNGKEISSTVAPPKSRVNPKMQQHQRALLNQRSERSSNPNVMVQGIMKNKNNNTSAVQLDCVLPCVTNARSSTDCENNRGSFDAKKEEISKVIVLETSENRNMNKPDDILPCRSSTDSIRKCRSFDVKKDNIFKKNYLKATGENRLSLPDFRKNKQQAYKKSNSLSSTDRLIKNAAFKHKSKRKFEAENERRLESHLVSQAWDLNGKLRDKAQLDKNNGNNDTDTHDATEPVAFDELNIELKQTDRVCVGLDNNGDAYLEADSNITDISKVMSGRTEHRCIDSIPINRIKKTCALLAGDSNVKKTCIDCQIDNEPTDQNENDNDNNHSGDDIDNETETTNDNDNENDNYNDIYNNSAINDNNDNNDNVDDNDNHNVNDNDTDSAPTDEIRDLFILNGLLSTEPLESKPIDVEDDYLAEVSSDDEESDDEELDDEESDGGESDNEKSDDEESDCGESEDDESNSGKQCFGVR